MEEFKAIEKALLGPHLPGEISPDPANDVQPSTQPQQANPTPYVVTTRHSPEPPQSLTDAEADIWRNTIGAITDDWIGTESYPQLMAYCRHAAYADRIAQKIELLENAGYDILEPAILKELRGLYRDFKEQTAAMSSFAVKLRISNSTTISRNTTKDKVRKGASLRDSFKR